MEVDKLGGARNEQYTLLLSEALSSTLPPERAGRAGIYFFLGEHLDSKIVLNM